MGWLDTSVLRHWVLLQLGPTWKPLIFIWQMSDEDQVVRESCEVALDMAEYEMSGDFQYANTIELMITEK